MLTITIMGGLGNQLFQIFTTIATALRNNDTFFFIEYQETPENSRYTHFWSTLFRGLRQYLTPSNAVTDKMFQSLNRWDEIGFHYTPIPTETNKYTKPLRLHGSFQSEKYFVDKYAEICKMIQLPQQQTWIKQIYGSDAWSGDYSGSPTKKRVLVGIHSKDGVSALSPNTSSEDYYYDAISHIVSSTSASPVPTAYSFLVFYDACDKDNVEIYIQTLKNRCAANINIEFHLVRNTIVDWQQMLLMSVCDHNIIANSTFSWWGAYFNANPQKVVCYPSTERATKDFLPESWIEINASMTT